MARRRLPVIINKTGLRGDDLRRLVVAAIADTKKRKSFVYAPTEVTFAPDKDYQTHGWSLYEDGKVVIKVARGFGCRAWEVLEVAQLLEHEFDHLCGAEHEEQGGDMLPWYELGAFWSDRIALRYRKGEGPHQLEKKIRVLTEKLIDVDTY